MLRVLWLILLLLPATLHAESYLRRVVHISKDHVLTVATGSQHVRLRVAGLNSLMMGAHQQLKVQKFLASLAFNLPVIAEVTGQDGAGMKTCRINAPRGDVYAQLLQAGYIGSAP